MAYKSNKTAVLFALKVCKHEFCAGVGTLAVAEVKSVTPVLTGNLKKSIVSEVMGGDVGVSVGVNANAKYGLYVEKGMGQPAQPFLEPGCMNAIPKITNVAEALYRSKMGGS